MRLIVSALAAVLLAGCTLEYVPKPSAEAVVDSALKPGQPVAIVNCTVATGDGYLRGLEASGVSWNFQTALDGAIVEVVNGVLTNYRVRQYVSE